MNKPTLKVNGQTYQMPTITPKFFREMTELENEEKEATSLADIIDSRVKFISVVFNVSIDAIKNNADIADVTTAYKGVIDYISKAVTGKVEEIPNGETVEEKTSI